MPESKTITKKCPCCKKEYLLMPGMEQPLCDKCYNVAARMLFSGIYDDLSSKEFKDAVQKEVLRGCIC